MLELIIYQKKVQAWGGGGGGRGETKIDVISNLEQA